MTSPGAPVSAKTQWTVSKRIDGPLVLDIAALAAFPIVRTVGDNMLIGVWTVAVLLLAMRWPASGLGLAAAIMVFPQSTRIGVDPSVALIAASSIGLAIDLARHGHPGEPMRHRMAIVVGGVTALAAATGVALVRSLVRLDADAAVEATRRWIEFGAGLAFFLMLIRVFSTGSIRPLVVGVIGISAAVGISLLELFAPGLLPSIGMAWLVPGAEELSRATGPFVSPNRLGIVAGVLGIVGVCQALTSDRWRWLWVAVTVLSTIVLIASFSRSALLGIAVAGAAVLVTRSRRLAARYVVAVTVAAVLVVPIFVGARLAGQSGTLEILLGNDQGRFDAWLAGIRMILVEPISGHGFHSFRMLGESYGATDGLRTAHNELIGLWAESGIVALLALLVTAGGIVATAVERRGDPWAMASIAVLTLFLVATSFNIQSKQLAVMGPVWLAIAYGIARPLSPAPIERSPPPRLA